MYVYIAYNMQTAIYRSKKSTLTDVFLCHFWIYPYLWPYTVRYMKCKHENALKQPHTDLPFVVTRRNGIRIGDSPATASSVNYYFCSDACSQHALNCIRIKDWASLGNEALLIQFGRLLSSVDRQLQRKPPSLLISLSSADHEWPTEGEATIG